MRRQRKAVVQRQENERGMLHMLYDILPTGAEQRDVGYRALASIMGVNAKAFQSAKNRFQHLGILNTRYVYEKKNAQSKVAGRLAYWTLLVPLETAMALFDAECVREDREWSERRITKHPRVTGADDAHPVNERALGPLVREERPAFAPEKSEEETRAIIGPQREGEFLVLGRLRKTLAEPAALVAAARQYRDRGQIVRQKLREMAEFGVTFDESRIGEVFHLAHDDRLQAVADTLPYIDQLERYVERQAADLVGLPELKNSVRRQHDQIQRLIAEKNGRQGTREA